MKRIKSLSIVVFLLNVFLLQAQSFQGKAYYQTKRNFDMKTSDSTTIDDAMQKQIREMIIKQFEKTYILTFNKTESVYKKEEKLNKPKPAQGGLVIEIVDGHTLLYKNYKENIYVQSQEEYGRNFLISDKLIPLKWDISKETKMIGKYLCIKATATKFINDYDENHNKKNQQKELKIVAWYTPEIPVAHGPELYGNLPGLILELHEDKMHYVCNKIVLNPSEKIEIIAPKKGKKINQKDFDEMMDKKQKQMLEQFKNNRKKGENGTTFSIQIGG